MKYLGTLSTGDESLPNLLDVKDGGSLDVIPVLLGKRISSAIHINKQTNTQKLISKSKPRKK